MVIAASNTSLNFLKLLAHDMRWQLLTALAKSDQRVQELVEQLKRPQNLVSYHLRLLREGQIVNERRSSADGRDVYYSLNLDHLRMLYEASGQTLHPALACAQLTPEAVRSQVSDDKSVGKKRPFRVLFLCTHNSARSQLAEGILRATGDHLIRLNLAKLSPSATSKWIKMGLDAVHTQPQHQYSS